MPSRYLLAILVLICLLVVVGIFIRQDKHTHQQEPARDVIKNPQTSLLSSPTSRVRELSPETHKPTTGSESENQYCKGPFQIKPAGIQKLLKNDKLKGLAESDFRLLIAALHDIDALFKEAMDPLSETEKPSLPEPYRQMSLERLMKEADDGDNTASRFVGKHLSFSALRKYTAQFAQTDESTEPQNTEFRLLSTDRGFVDGINYLNASCASDDNDACYSAYFMSLLAESATWRRRPQTNSQEWQHFRIQRFAYAEMMTAIGSPGMRYMIASDNVELLPENESGNYPNELSSDEKIAVQKQAQELATITQHTLEHKQPEEKERMDWLKRWGYLEKFHTEVEIMCQ